MKRRLLSILLCMAMTCSPALLTACQTEPGGEEPSGSAFSTDTAAPTEEATTAAKDQNTVEEETTSEPAFVMENLYNPSKAFAGYINGKTGAEVAYSGHFTSDYIAVKGGDIITFGPCNPSQGYHLHGYKADQTIASNANTVSADRLTVVDSFGKYVIYSYTVPSNVTSVRISNDSKVNSLFLVVKGHYFDTEMLLEHFNYLENQSLKQRIGEYFGTRDDSVLYRKSALFTGDSICDGTQDSGIFYDAWAGRIGEINQMDYVNAGLSGTSVSTCRANRYGRILTQLEQNKDKNFDYVIMHGGVNDAWDSVAIGTVAADFELSSFRTDTFAGGLEELFYYAKTYYPDAQLGFVLNFKIVNSSVSSVNQKLGDYFAVAKQICDKWDIPYLDLYSDEDVMRDLAIGSNTYLGDYIHPNCAGYDRLYVYIERWMETLGSEQA